MAGTIDTRKGFDGKTLDGIQSGEQVRLHGQYDDYVVEFVEWTGEVAIPREAGAVARIATKNGYTDTRVAGELSRLEEPREKDHAREAAYVSGPANVTPDERRRRRVAELRVLETFDTIRDGLGHDFGSGQRGKELIRRRRELGIARGETPSSTPDELAAAFERIGRPRVRRLEELEGYRSTTPATIRTRDAWRRVERAIERAATTIPAASAVPPATMRPATFKIGGAPAVAPLMTGRPTETDGIHTWDAETGAPLDEAGR